MTETLNSQAEFLAGEVGLEPTVHGIKIRCLTNLAIPQGAPKAATKGATGLTWAGKTIRENPFRVTSVLIEYFRRLRGFQVFPLLPQKCEPGEMSNFQAREVVETETV